jgi:hypothetical protein
MPAAFLVPCLVQLRAEFNQQNPGRDKGADGWIGDAAHATRPSDHNPDAEGRVLAIDIDATGPWPRGNDIGDYAEFLRQRQNSGADSRLEYIIHNRHMCSRSSSWEWQAYTGDDPHINHAHFSARHDHSGQDTASAWQLGEVGIVAHDPLDTTDAQTVWTKGGADAQNNASGYATGLRKQTTAVVDPRFDSLDEAVAALQTTVNSVNELIEALNHDPADGGPSAIQLAIADAVWTRGERTLTA